MTFTADILITALATVAGSAIGGLLTWHAAKSSARVSALELENAHLRSLAAFALRQVEGYHVGETLLAGRLEEAGCGGARGIKTEVRDQVLEAGFMRPRTTAIEARRMLVDLEHRNAPASSDSGG